MRQRLQENAEVVGADETFFEDQDDSQAIRDLFTEKAGILDGDEDTEVDLASYAYQIWKNAIDRDPDLRAAESALLRRKLMALHGQALGLADVG